MTASVVLATLGQLVIGFGLTTIPFLVGCFFAGRRVHELQERADHFEERYFDALEMIQRAESERMRRHPSARSLSEPGLRIVRGGQ